MALMHIPWKQLAADGITHTIIYRWLCPQNEYNLALLLAGKGNAKKRNAQIFTDLFKQRLLV
jgi:hypothetical protein